MIITVKSYLNTADSYRGELELPDGSTVGNALDALGLLDHIDIDSQTLIILLNGQNADIKTSLVKGDKLHLLQSMAGG